MVEQWIATARRELGGWERILICAFGITLVIGFTWGLPNSNTWAVDSLSPRSCGLGALVETYRSGHFHLYPPLHMALLTILSLPWIGLAILRVGSGADALSAELIKPLYMTGIEVSARALAAGMAVGIVVIGVRWWTRLEGRFAGVGAGVVVATNAPFVYYAHTGNPDVPYLFWTSWALLEMDRVLAGERRERRALLLAAAAVLSKDQAAGALLLPLPFALVIVPWAARRASPIRRDLVSGAVVATVAYAFVSGALVNPTGFRRHVAFILGPGSQAWYRYPAGWHGALLVLADIVRAIPNFTSWPIAAAAVLGIVVVVSTTRGVDRARMLLPLLAAVSFTAFIAVGARRVEDRFFMPGMLFGLPYASVPLSRAWSSWRRGRPWFAAIAAASTALALVGVASVDGTLLADSRYEAERFLANLPPASHVEVYGTSLFLPRLPAGLHAVRPGVQPLAERQAIPGVIDLVDPEMDPRLRSPDVIVLGASLSLEDVTRPPPSPGMRPAEATAYHEPVSHRLYGELFDGSLGYTRVLDARCALPWPLECRHIHGAIGGDVWIYARGAGTAASP